MCKEGWNVVWSLKKIAQKKKKREKISNLLFVSQDGGGDEEEEGLKRHDLEWRRLCEMPTTAYSR